MRAFALVLLLAVGCGSDSGASDTGHPGSTPCDRTDVVISGWGSVPGLGWLRSAEVEPHAVAVDAEGNVFVGGELALGADLGGGTLAGEPGTSFANDAFLVSYTASGEHRWSKRFGGQGYDRFLGLDIDANGALYATGEFTQGANLGPGALTEDQVLVAGFSNEGDLRWTTELDVARAQDLRAQPDGTLYVTGEFGGTVDLGAGPLTSAGLDGFLVSLGSDGSYRWSTHVAGTGNEYGWALATDGSGVVVIGAFSSTTTIGSVPLEGTGNDIFVASFDESGGHRWSRAAGGAEGNWPGGVAVGTDGATYATGSHDVDGIGTANESDFFLSSFDATGAEGAKFEPGGPGFAIGTAAAVDSSGNVFVAARFGGTTDLGGGEFQTESGQAVLASYGSELGHRWSLALDWIGPPSGPDGVAVGPAGAVYVIGHFSIPHDDNGINVAARTFLVQFRQDCAERSDAEVE
jgi:hypothetical protein